MFHEKFGWLTLAMTLCAHAPCAERLDLAAEIRSQPVGKKQNSTTDMALGAVDEEALAENARPVPPRISPPSPGEVKAMIAQVAAQHMLDPDLVQALVKAESAYNAHAVSPVGAVGLMQVMPATAADYGVTSTTALFDPAINLRTGMRHLKRLIEKYGNIGHAVMAYNAGEGALERHRGFVSYPETQRYTHAVLVAYLQKKGVTPYSSQGNQAIGLSLTPAMGDATGHPEYRDPNAETSRRSRIAIDAAPDAPLNSNVEKTQPVNRPRATRLTSRLAPELSMRDDRQMTLSTMNLKSDTLKHDRPFRHDTLRTLRRQIAQ